jgi:hypothetical protein
MENPVLISISTFRLKVERITGLVGDLAKSAADSDRQSERCSTDAEKSLLTPTILRKPSKTPIGKRKK